MKVNITRLMSGFWLLSAAGCSNYNTSATQFAAGAVIHTSSVEAYTTYQQTASSQSYKETITALGNMSLTYQSYAATADATNDTVAIDAYTFSGIADQVAANQDNFAAAANAYPSLADYWDSIGFDPQQTINQADFLAGLAAIDKVLNPTTSGAETALTADERIAATKAYIVFSSMGVQTNSALALAGGHNTMLGLTAGQFFSNVGRFLANPIGYIIEATSKQTVNNNVCTGSGTINQNGNSNTVGPIGATKTFSNNNNGATGSQCPASSVVLSSDTKVEANNNVGTGSNSIGQNGNGNSIALTK